jgi:hypothetical protein
MLRSLVRFQTVHGEVVQRGDLRVTPMARTLVLCAPQRIPLAMSWSWPAAVTVQQGDGAPTVVPIVDPTRLVLLGLSVVAAVTGLVAMLVGSSRECRR